MRTPSPCQDLARRLLAVESARRPSGMPGNEALQVCEKLQLSLTRLAGPEGFASLLRRALVLARMDVPALQAVTLKPDGSLQGQEILAVNEEGGAVVLIARLLELLVTFVGEPLTLALLRDTWPDVSSVQ
jgi:hypothetical protein